MIFYPYTAYRIITVALTPRSWDLAFPLDKVSGDWPISLPPSPNYAYIVLASFPERKKKSPTINFCGRDPMRERKKSETVLVCAI